MIPHGKTTYHYVTDTQKLLLWFYAQLISALVPVTVLS